MIAAACTDKKVQIWSRFGGECANLLKSIILYSMPQRVMYLL